MEVIVAVTVAAAVMPVGNPERAIDGADSGSNRAAHDGTDRSGGAFALARAALFAADQALRMPEMGDREQRQNDCRACQAKLCGRTGRHCRCPDLRIHVKSWLLGR
jgi:hypothetical protein